jgi:hypothetical protein
MSEISGLSSRVAATKAFIVAINDLSKIVDDIDGVVGLPAIRERMTGSDNDPEPKLPGQRHHVFCAFLQPRPIEPVKGINIDPGISRKRPLTEMREMPPRFFALRICRMMRRALARGSSQTGNWQVAIFSFISHPIVYV